MQPTSLAALPLDHPSQTDSCSEHCLRITVLVMGILSTLIGLLALLHAYEVLPLGDSFISNFGISVGYPLAGAGLLSLFLSTLDCCMPQCSYPEMHHEKMVEVMVQTIRPFCKSANQVSLSFALKPKMVPLVWNKPFKEKEINDQILEWCAQHLMSEHRGTIHYEILVKENNQPSQAHKFTYQL